MINRLPPHATPTSSHSPSPLNMKFSLFFFSTVLLGAHAVLVNEGRLLRGLQANKVDICHFDEEDSTWNTISVSANGNAVTAHKNHGDFICGENSLECNASLGCVCPMKRGRHEQPINRARF